ncbi:hypothetical protein DEU56DRAFT_982580 [Suillus clintonianus]|uniref:uncharacterized protein n=1 Tax=Suillus clintonianus TaxID=1904413 RepID=UPI001B87A5BA|nr:uncharacterized protein DEU56DRAFT_982580 [Suillus clintonianus]KAG2128241.1 hypothetical protein DEU56DRAFT_982580 [Suillus clintonianus]
MMDENVHNHGTFDDCQDILKPSALRCNSPRRRRQQLNSPLLLFYSDTLALTAPTLIPMLQIIALMSNLWDIFSGVFYANHIVLHGLHSRNGHTLDIKMHIAYAYLHLLRCKNVSSTDKSSMNLRC